MAKYKSRFTGEEIDNKFGDVIFDPITSSQIFFPSREDKLAYLMGDTSVPHFVCPFEFAGTMHRMTIENLMDGKTLYYTQMSAKAVISVGFKSEQKSFTDTSWTTVDEDAYITVEVDRGFTGKFTTVVDSQLVLSGRTFEVDVFKYLATGGNRVRIRAVGVDTEASGDFTYTVNLTSMYIAPANFKWNTPFIEGQPFTLGGLHIGGAIDKVLKIKVTGEDYEKDYEVNMGTQTHTSIAYYFTGMEFPNTGTGIYNVELWLDANGLESDHLSYNIICVATADSSTAQLIAVNEVLPTVANYGTNKLFSYAVYNGGASTASPIVNVSSLINGVSTPIVEAETLVDVTTATINDYILDLEIDSQENTINLTASIELGESKHDLTYSVDNSLSYPAVDGAVFYLNPANRNNAQADRETIINESTKSDVKQYTATWKGVSYIDGMDGWTTDNNGRKCLRLPAGSRVDVDYSPYLNATTRTIEVYYKVENASDYSEDVIRIASDLTSQFIGARIKPTNVVLHSQGLRSDDLMQGYNLKDEEPVHLLITVIQNYKQIGNIAQIYVNGVKKCSFEWSASDTFAHSGKLSFGSDTADLYIYKCRVYTEAFDWVMAGKNFISCLPDTESKTAAYAKFYSVLTDDNNISFEKVKEAGLNYFILRLPDGAKLPSALSQTSVPHSRLEINIQQNPDFAINGIYEDEETEGQGTTAMNYFRWNIRWKTINIRITAKKNFASSMHSHKMGATALFNDLNRMIVGPNEADARVAVEQYGAYGFIEVLVEGTTDQYTRIPIGLYTIGQDKGDKTTFGYNNKEYKDTLIHLEGTDHSPKGVGMDYPWHKLSVATNADGDSNLGVTNPDNSVIAAWEIGACGSAESDFEQYVYLESEFQPAYDVDYRNTSMLVGLASGTTIDSVNNNLSAFRATETDLGYTNADCLIYIDGEFDTYYYDVIQGKYVKDGINILTDLGITASDLTGSVADKTRQIRLLRMQRYRDEMEKYWHLRDSLFHYCFVVLFAATDNFKKNTYPYKFGTLASGSRWRWRQDDLDTLFDINNQGLANKIYSILNGDKSGTTHLFRGNTSYHWTNIQFYYENEIKGMMLEILTAMASLADEGDSLIEKAVACIRKYFWNKAQDYFTKSAYNIDADWTYEEAWAAMKNGTYKAPVHPLQQSLGDHYEAERAFVELRFIFMASLYGFGAFGVGNDSDTSLGQISFRPAQGDNTFQLTPAINMNPTILVGDSDRKTADGRLLAGETAEITVSTDGDTSIYIQGADYLSDIGDFSKINLYAENPALTVQSKRLQTLKVGDENPEEVTTLLKTLNVLSCPSLSSVDARNVSTLTGTVDLSQCPRLTSALFGGSSAGEIALPKGSKITAFELPDTIDRITLMNLPLLTEEGLAHGELTALTYLRVENNPHINGYGLLKATYDDGAPLSNIRIIGFDYEGDTTDIQLLSKLASGGYFGIKDDGSNDYNILPVIEGTLHVDKITEDDLTNLTEAFKVTIDYNSIVRYIKFADSVVEQICAENWGNGVGITEEDAAKVTSIGTVFQGNTEITSFDELQYFTGLKSITGFNRCTSLSSVVLPNSATHILEYTFEYTGLRSIQMNEGLRSIGTAAFWNSSLEEVTIPSTITSLSTVVSVFVNCTDLRSVTFLGKITSIGNLMFRGCSNLEVINVDWDGITSIGAETFLGCKKLNIPIPRNITSIQNGSYSDTGIESIDIPSGVTSIGSYAFSSCKKLTNVHIPEGVTTLGQEAFAYGGSLVEVDIPSTITNIGNCCFFNNPLVTAICRATVPPSFGLIVFNNVASNFAIYVPDQSVQAYREASGWLDYADWIWPMEGYLYGIIKFADPAVEAICVANWDTNGTGYLNKEEAKAVTSLGTVFKGNTEITSFNELEEFTGLTSISTGAFERCSNLSSVKLPNGITDIGGNAFVDCSSLTNIDIPDGVTTLGAGSFARSGLTGIVIPDSVTTLGDSVFATCSKLKTIKFGSGLNKFGGGIFAGVSFENIYVDSISAWCNYPITNIQSTNAKLYVKDEHVTEVVIPSDVTILRDGVFFGFIDIHSVSFDGEITTIASGAFNSCGLTSFVCPQGVVNLQGAVFPWCRKLVTLDLSNYHGSLGENFCIGGSVLTLVKLGNVTDIGNYAFSQCSALQSVLINATTPPTLGSSVFGGSASIYVPDASVDAYKAKENWSTYADRIKPLSQYVES